MQAFLCTPTDGQQQVTKNFGVGLRFEGSSKQARHQQGKKANQVLLSLSKRQQSLLNPENAQQDYQIIQEQPELSGVQGTALLAAGLQDRSNIGQSAYLQLLTALKNSFQQEDRFIYALNLFQKHIDEAEQWWLWGIAPYINYQLAHHFRVSSRYIEAQLLGARRVYDGFMSSALQLETPLPIISFSQLKQALEAFFSKIEHQLAKETSLSKIQLVFQNKVRKVQQNLDLVCLTMFKSLQVYWSTSAVCQRSRWKLVEHCSRLVQEKIDTPTKSNKYLSIVRQVLTRAFSTVLKMEETVVQALTSQKLCAERMLSLPYVKPRKKYHFSSLALVMGQKYVIPRNGNAKELTIKIKEENPVHLIFPRPKMSGLPSGRVIATVVVHKRLQEIIDQPGVSFQLFQLQLGRAPYFKIRVRLVLSGPKKAFYNVAGVAKAPNYIQPVAHPKQALGVDANRPGKDILGFSESVDMPKQLENTVQRYYHQQQELRPLDRKITHLTRVHQPLSEADCQRQLTKVLGERERLEVAIKEQIKAIHR